jgi:hypothetical protein
MTDDEIAVEWNAFLSEWSEPEQPEQTWCFKTPYGLPGWRYRTRQGDLLFVRQVWGADLFPNRPKLPRRIPTAIGSILLSRSFQAAPPGPAMQPGGVG